MVEGGWLTYFYSSGAPIISNYNPPELPHLAKSFLSKYPLRVVNSSVEKDYFNLSCKGHENPFLNAYSKSIFTDLLLL